MSDLTNLYIDDAYPGLLHANAAELPANGQQAIYDGNGNRSSMSVGRACNGVTICGTLSASNIIINGKSIIDIIWPLGSLYFSPVDQSIQPTVLFSSATWTLVSVGAYLASVGEGTDANGTLFTIGEKLNLGGENTHTLTVSEMPSHTHTMTTWSQYAGTTDAGLWPDVTSIPMSNPSVVPSVGSSAAHTNRTPSTPLYIYQRTA